MNKSLVAVRSSLKRQRQAVLSSGPKDKTAFLLLNLHSRIIHHDDEQDQFYDINYYLQILTLHVINELYDELDITGVPEKYIWTVHVPIEGRLVRKITVGRLHSRTERKELKLGISVPLKLPNFRNIDQFSLALVDWVTQWYVAKD